jgi:hypothetical protein
MNRFQQIDDIINNLRSAVFYWMSDNYSDMKYYDKRMKEAARLAREYDFSDEELQAILDNDPNLLQTVEDIRRFN